jgi:hypothetical protein
MAGDTPPFVIRELSGDKRAIRLVGRALPLESFELETTQRVEIEWLPGSPEGTATVLGPTEKPSQLHGEWKDKFLGQPEGSGESLPFTLNNSPITVVTDAVNLMDSFVRFGQLLEVTWLDTTRRGFLTTFRKRWKNAHDVEWNMEFAWINRGDNPGPSAFSVNRQLTDSAARLRQQLDDLDDIGVPSGFGLSLQFLNGIQDLQHSIEDLINNIEDTVQNFTNQVLTPVRAARGVVATLSGIVEEAKTMADFVGNQVSGAINGDTPVDDQTYTERFSAAVYQEQVKAWADEMRRIAIDERDNAQDQIVTDVLGVYVARAGEDLRDVSRIFYNTPFEWRRIMVFNDLNTAELTAGQVVLVPKLNPQEAGQQNPGT